MEKFFSDLSFFFLWKSRLFQIYVSSVPIQSFNKYSLPTTANTINRSLPGGEIVIG